MSTLALAPVGPVADSVLDCMQLVATRALGLPVHRVPALPLPDAPGARIRGQYQSVEVLKLLARSRPAGALRILGVTEEDLTIPMLTFLFGQAQLDGPVAVVSLHRLRQEFYGLAPDQALLEERLAKEMLHELGHTFGLVHCPGFDCAMSLSTHIGLVDAKQASYCPSCAARVARRIDSFTRKEHDEEHLADPRS